MLKEASDSVPRIFIRDSLYECLLKIPDSQREITLFVSFAQRVRYIEPPLSVRE